MNKVNLVLHCGAAAVDRSSVAAVPTPEPTKSHMPIAHLTLVEQIEGALSERDLRVVSEAHALTKDGARYFGLMQIARGSASDEWSSLVPAPTADGFVDWSPPDHAFILGLRNTHDYSFAASLVAGSGVFVCDNLSFSGEVKVSRKHTTHIVRDLPALVGKAIGLLAEKWVSQEKRFEAYRSTGLSNVEAHDLLIQALDARAITGQQIPHVLREWRTPRHPEFAEAGKTCWRLLNACTEVCKGTNLFALPARTTRLHGLLDSHCGLLTAEEKAAAILADVGEDAQIELN
jgi:Domain of unknown function (DUF932)